MAVIKTTAILAISSLLPSGAFCATSTAMPSTPSQQVMIFFANFEVNEYSYGLNKLQHESIGIEDIALVGGQLMSTGTAWEIDSIPPPHPYGPYDLDTANFFATLHCTAMDADTDSGGLRPRTAFQGEKQTCNVDICQGKKENEEADCINIRFLDCSTSFSLPIQMEQRGQRDPFPVRRRLEPALDVMVMGAVTGGTGIYSGTIGGEARVYDQGSFTIPGGGYGGQHAFEVSLISSPSPDPSPVLASVESSSKSSATSNSLDVSNGGTIKETFIAFRSKDTSGFGIRKLTDPLYNDSKANAGEQRVSVWDVFKSSDCDGGGDCNDIPNPENFMTSFCTDFAQWYSWSNSISLRYDCNYDLCFGKNEEGEPNCIFTKGIDNYGVEGRRPITLSVMGGTGIYRSKGGQAHINVNSSFTSLTIEVELIPYLLGVNLWDE